jgi:hypothetical protein
MLNLFVPNRFESRVIWQLVQNFDPIVKRLNLIVQTKGPSSRLEQFDWKKWLEKAAEVLGSQKLVPVFYFPPQDGRKKCSIWMFDDVGNPVAYAKIAWGEEEVRQTQLERRAYSFCENFDFQSFESPTVIYSGELDGRIYNLFSNFPSNLSYAPGKWSEVYQYAWQELSTRTSKRIHLEEFSWWNERGGFGAPWDKAYKIIEMDEPETGYSFYSAHGDFAIWNARMRSGRLFLFDWECFDENAPLFLDPFYFFLSREIFLKKGTNPNSILNVLKHEFFPISSIYPKPRDLLLVLVYLRNYNVGRNLDRELDELASTLVADKELTLILNSEDSSSP